MIHGAHDFFRSAASAVVPPAKSLDFGSSFPGLSVDLNVDSDGFDETGVAFVILVGLVFGVLLRERVFEIVDRWILLNLLGLFLLAALGGDPER